MNRFIKITDRIGILFCSFWLTVSLSIGQVRLKVGAGDTVTLSNKTISFSFIKTQGVLCCIRFNKQDNLLGNKGSAYLSGPDFSMTPSRFSIICSNNRKAEIAFFHQGDNHFTYELHYVLRADINGIYCFLIQRHSQKEAPGNYGQTRWGLRADENLFDYHLVRDSIQGSMPKMADLLKGKKIQDWTYQLPDGQIYTKYDYADYIEGRYVHGMAGRKSGLGLFVIQASHEYLNGGPTKQYQNVHANPFLIYMFNCSHFLSDIRKGDNIIRDDWEKIDGPFLLYVNKGKNIEAIWKDAKRQSLKEIKQWPYSWMRNSAYPLLRGSLKGCFSDAKKNPEANVHVIVADSGYDWQAQSKGYIYATVTDRQGRFQIHHVREGRYRLFAYGNNQMEEFQSKNWICIKKNNILNLGNLTYDPTDSGRLIWQIGISDRRTKGFKFSEHKRVYGLFNKVPDSLDFHIGKSIENRDWYYAQTKPGTWNIHFEFQPTSSDKQAHLSIAIAGAARWPVLEIIVNGTVVGKLSDLGNDASVYRSAVAGGYYQLRNLVFPCSLLHQGNNTIGLHLTQIKQGGGIMYDAIKLETK